MRVRSMLGCAAAAGAIAALAAGTLSAAAGGGAERSSVKTTKLVYYPGQPQIGPTTIDVGPAGESQGDMTVVTRPVLRRPNGSVVGRTDVKCVMTDVTQPGHPFLECNGLFRFDRGEDLITFEGGFRFPDESTSELAVTGGTGRFKSVGGEFIRAQGGAQPRYILKLRSLGR